MHRPPLTRLLAAFALLAALAPPAPAEETAPPQATGSEAAEETPPLPITLATDPDIVMLEDAVTIKGRTGGTEGAEVTILVEPPAEVAETLKPVTLTAKIDAGGNFTQTFKETKAPGRYLVTATAPDGRGRQQSHFDVYIESIDGDLSKDDAPNELIDAGENLTHAIEGAISSLPPSLEKEELVAELKMVSDAIAKLGRFPPLPPVLADGKIAQKSLDPEGLERYRQGRRRVMRSFVRAREITKSSAEHLNKINSVRTSCDDLEVVKEGLQFVSFMMNFAEKGLYDVFVGFGKEFIAIAASNKAKKANVGDAGTFALSEGIKQIDSLVEKRLKANDAFSVVYDGLGVAADKIMGSFCQVFTGPIEGTMSAEFRAKNGETWWTYDFKITGRITFHHDKQAKGDRVGIKGRIEGYAHSFKTWEDALGVDGPKGTLVAAKIVFPPFDEGAKLATTLADYDEGSVAGALLPNSFFIAIDGELAYDKKTVDLRLGPARTDIDVKSRVVNIVISPFLLAPTPVIYVLPYKDARFLMQRAFQGEIVQMPLDIQGKTMSINKVFSYQGGGTGATGSYRLSIQAKSDK